MFWERERRAGDSMCVRISETEAAKKIYWILSNKKYSRDYFLRLNHEPRTSTNDSYFVDKVLRIFVRCENESSDCPK
jgi:hypothetical protein